jgi:Mrp family chromosome partitioning ATPase
VLAVTIPTDEAQESVARTLRATAAAGIRLLGLIENMAGYRCPGCGDISPLFPGSAGLALAAAFGIPLLARIPFLADRVPAPTDWESERVLEAIT